MSSKSVNGWGFLNIIVLSGTKHRCLALGTEALQMKETSWVDGVRGFLLPTATRRKGWGIDELYNTLRQFRHDQGTTLDAYIKVASGLFCFLLVRVGLGWVSSYMCTLSMYNLDMGQSCVKDLLV